MVGDLIAWLTNHKVDRRGQIGDIEEAKGAGQVFGLSLFLPCLRYLRYTYSGSPANE